MAVRWIDFTEVKRQVPIRSILERYGYLGNLTEKKQGKLIGPCPIHGGTNATSFHVDCEKNIFNCFSECGGGNVLDLVMKIEGIEIREAAERICAWFEIAHERKPKRAASSGYSAKVSQKTDTQPAAPSAEASVNPPLARPLQNLNQDHPYLVKRGLTVPTIRYFQPLGMCSRGIMKGRIAIGINDENGNLVAYAGRAVTDELAKEKGKYRLPDGFKKSHVLFNLNRAKEHAENGLIVVEGFFDCMKVAQTIGLERANVIALMGCMLSEHQEQLILAHTDRVALMLDGDDAGTEAKRDIWRRLVRKLYLRDVHLEDGEHPDNLTEDRIREILS